MISKTTNFSVQQPCMYVLKRVITGGLLSTLVLSFQAVDANGASIAPPTTASTAVGQRTIPCKVADESGNAIAGAMVTIKGTSRYTLSDETGHFQLNVSDNNALLVVSYTGFERQEIAIGTQNTLIISLTIG